MRRRPGSKSVVLGAVALFLTGLATAAVAEGTVTDPVISGEKDIGLRLSEKPGAPVPEWLIQEMALRVEKTGRWIADNRPFKNADEPYDQYGVEWRRGLGQQTLVGRLFALREGKEVGDFWEYRLTWNPAEAKAYLEQWGRGGAYGVGELRSLGGGATECIQLFSMPGVPSWASRHRATLVSGEDRTVGEDYAKGAWQPGRQYVWRLQP